MTFPMFVKEEEKRELKKESRKKEERQVKVRPQVKELIERGIKENAPTWAELANR